MKVLSIDVGIKNLAFCLLEKQDTSENFTIQKWNSINVSEKVVSTCSFIEKNKVCNKPAKFSKDNQCFCLKHSKKQCYQIPTSDLKTTYINKQKIHKLLNSIEIEKPKTEKETTKEEQE
jgi:recombinational DNA repair protein RecR